MEDFPEEFSMATDPNSVVASCMSIHGEELVWQLNLRRTTFDWEILTVIQMLECLLEAWIYILEERTVECGGRDLRASSQLDSSYEHVVDAVEVPSPWKVV